MKFLVRQQNLIRIMSAVAVFTVAFIFIISFKTVYGAEPGEQEILSGTPTLDISGDISGDDSGSDESLCLQDESCVYAKYTDTNTRALYHDGVHFCVKNGYMIGSSDTAFEPDSKLNRSMVACIVWNMENQPYADFAISFDDVEDDSWYTEAVRWTQAEGIVNGYNDNVFGPEDLVNYEQLTTVLYRYAEYKGIDLSQQKYPNGLDDSDKISTWALKSIVWANAAGIISKDTAEYSPKETLSRADTANVIMNFCNLVINADSAVKESGRNDAVTDDSGLTEEQNNSKNTAVRTESAIAGIESESEADVAQTEPDIVNIQTKAGIDDVKTGADIDDVNTEAGISEVQVYPDITIGRNQKVSKGVYALNGGTYANVTISALIGDDNVTLNNVTVTGRLVVLGGGSDSVSLNDCIIKDIEINKQGGETPGINIQNTTVKDIRVLQPAIIEADSDSDIVKLEALNDVTIKGLETKVRNLEIPKETAKTVVIDVRNGTIDTIKADQPARIKSSTGLGFVKLVKVCADITVESDIADYVTVAAEAAVTVTGNMSVQIAIETTENVTITSQSAMVELTGSASNNPNVILYQQ